MSLILVARGPVQSSILDVNNYDALIISHKQYLACFVTTSDMQYLACHSIFLHNSRKREIFEINRFIDILNSH